jgi:hypothetical protein
MVPGARQDLPRYEWVDFLRLLASERKGLLVYNDGRNGMPGCDDKVAREQHVLQLRAKLQERRSVP